MVSLPGAYIAVTDRGPGSRGTILIQMRNKSTKPETMALAHDTFGKATLIECPYLPQSVRMDPLMLQSAMVRSP